MPSFDSAHAYTDHPLAATRTDHHARELTDPPHLRVASSRVDHHGEAGMTDTPTRSPTRATDDGREAQAQLRRLRRLIGEQFAAEVNEGHLAIDVANGMLDVFGMPELPRRWQVRLGLPMVCEVAAARAVDAFDAAAAVIERALRATVAGAFIDIEFDGREDLHATPGDVDADALTADWPDSQARTG